MAPPPPVKKEIYTRWKRGCMGQLGGGANAIVRFVQTAISAAELDDITLIQNIPGSERWDVRDLFQRDVDQERVTNHLLPYLKDDSKVKFFNPLTLVFLPFAGDHWEISKRLVAVRPKDEEEEGHKYTVWERRGLFVFKQHIDDSAFSRVGWNNQTVRLVAIDGQHRLQALKRWKDSPGDLESDLASWQIPVVILGLFRLDDDKPSDNLLEIVRKTFVYINMKSEQLSDARAILLDDESVNAICTQEFVQQAHANDVLEFDDRDPGKLPLIFFDWRGATHNYERVRGPAAVKSIEELKEWFEYYLLDEDGSPSQESALELDDLIPPLRSFGKDKTLTQEDARKVRAQFRNTMLPGLSHLLEHFEPYKRYVAQCRELEAHALKESDLAHHAFGKIRFGFSTATQDQLEGVHIKHKELVEKFSLLKTSFPELIAREIGMRGVICAFGTSKVIEDERAGKTSSWIEHARWYTPAINRVYKDGWFASYQDLKPHQKKFLTHICFDWGGNITNYRYNDIEGALGALLLLLVFNSNGEIDALSEVWERVSSDLRATLKKSFRKYHKAREKDTFKGTTKQFTAHIDKLAGSSADEQLSDLSAFLKI